MLTELFNWRAIFVFQAPVALIALVAAFESHLHPRGEGDRRGSNAANVALGFLFGALVGALFLGVLLVITVWGLSPITGALVVSALPTGAVAARWLERRLAPRLSAAAGACFLAAGLFALALLPSISNVLVASALAFCGFGLGLAVPVLSHAAVPPGTGVVRRRHPHDRRPPRRPSRRARARRAAPLPRPRARRQNALLAGTRVILDGNAPLRQKVPIALDLRRALEQAPKGVVPDLREPFDSRGAQHDENLRHVRDSLINALQGALTRSFRLAFVLSALFALVALLPDPRRAPTGGGAMKTTRTGRIALAALAGGAAALLVVELALGALHFGSTKLADPAHPSRRSAAAASTAPSSGLPSRA